MKMAPEELPFRWRCDTCNHIFADAEFLVAPNPFDITDTVNGCPKCSAVNDFTNICDIPTCEREASCGWPSDQGYRRTCGNHMRKPL